MSHAALVSAAHRDAEDEEDGGDDGPDHGHHQHVETLLGKHGHHLCLDLTARADEYLVVGGELRLVQFSRILAGFGDGRHGQVVRGKVVKIGQLGLNKKINISRLDRYNND